MDEVEIIRLHKRCNKTGAKVASKADAKIYAKAAAKSPRSRYYLFLKEQLGRMTGEDQKNYRSIVSRGWKKINEDPARLFAYNNRARQMRDEPEKPTKSVDSLIGSIVQHEETVTEGFVVKRTQRQPQKAPKSPEFVETESDDSDYDDEERKPMV